MSTAAHRTTRLTATITVHSYEPTAFEAPDGGPALYRIHVTEEFRGDIEGTGVAEFLQAERNDKTASFTGMERVTGTVAGKEGTFLLQDAGTVEGQVVEGTWFVIPGSGTGGLAGLRGTGGFTANLGESAQARLDYWFE